MATLTENFQITLPSRGEDKGTWDLPINNAFKAIDQLIWKLNINNSSALEDPNAQVGSLWYSTIKNVLFVKTPDGMKRTADHVHDGIDLPKIDLTDGKQVKGLLPSFMVDVTNLNAGTLGGLTKDQLFRIAGTGLRGDGPTVSLEITGVIPGSYNSLTVDEYGRVIRGENLSAENTHVHADYALKTGSEDTRFNVAAPVTQNNAIPLIYAAATFAVKSGDSDSIFRVANGIEINDAVSLGQLQANYALKTHTHAIYAALIHSHDAYALTDHTHAEFANIGIAEGVYAKIDGDANQRFSVANAISGSDALSKDYATTLFAPVSHAHASLYAAINHTHTSYSLSGHDHADLYPSITHNHDTVYAKLNQLNHDHNGTYLKVDSSNTITGINSFSNVTYFTSAVKIEEPTAPDEPASKFYVDNLAFTGMTEEQADTRYALINGDIINTFEAAQPVKDSDVVNKMYANSVYSAKGHLHNDAYVRLDDVTIDIHRQVKELPYGNAIVTCSVDGEGRPNYLSASGNQINVNVTNYPFFAVIGSGIDTLGFKTETVNLESTNTGVLSRVLPPSKHYWIYIAYVDDVITVDGTDIEPLTVPVLPSVGNTTGQFAFSVTDNKSYMWDGSMWVPDRRMIFIGECDTDATSAIKNIVHYGQRMLHGIGVSEPVYDESAVPKKWANETYALKHGDSTLTFEAAAPVAETDVVTKGFADTSYASASALSAHDHNERYSLSAHNHDARYVIKNTQAAISNASGSAAAAYDAATQTLINDLTAKLNSALAALRAHGIIS